jgi:hypothetical protein
MSALPLRLGASAWVNANPCKAMLSMPPWRTIRGDCNAALTDCYRLSVRNGQRLTLANAWRRLDKGGVHDVAQWIEHAEKSALCGFGHITMIAVHCDYRDDDRTLTAWFKLPEPLPGRRELVCEFLLDLHEWLEGRQPAPKLLMPDPHVTLH